MPQSRGVTAERTAKLPEHTAEAAAARQNSSVHQSKHEETVQAEDHSHNQPEADKLHHGKDVKK